MSINHVVSVPFFNMLCYTRQTSQHINEITAKAHKCANCILRCFASRDVKLLVRAFIVYVYTPNLRVQLCHMVAVPEKKEISQIEKVQRRFTKRLRGLRNIGYTLSLIHI